MLYEEMVHDGYLDLMIPCSLVLPLYPNNNTITYDETAKQPTKDRGDNVSTLSSIIIR